MLKHWRHRNRPIKSIGGDKDQEILSQWAKLEENTQTEKGGDTYYGTQTSFSDLPRIDKNYLTKLVRKKAPRSDTTGSPTLFMFESNLKDVSMEGDTMDTGTTENPEPGTPRKKEKPKRWKKWFHD